MSRKTLLLVAAVIVIAGGYVTYKLVNHESITPEPQYKMVTDYNDGNFLYSCSRPIKAKLQSIPGPGNKDYKSYVPVDSDEAKLICQSNAAVENEGKLKVLQRPEVVKLVEKYQYKDISLKALEFKYIKDPEYVHRLLPAYKDKEIGCIIVLETPDSGKVYLENEKLETFEELDYKTFKQYVAEASSADKQMFYDNLR